MIGIEGWRAVFVPRLAVERGFATRFGRVDRRERLDLLGFFSFDDATARFMAPVSYSIYR